LGGRYAYALFTRVTGVLHVFNLLHDLLQIVAGRVLQRREATRAKARRPPNG